MKRWTVYKNPYTPSNPTYYVYDRTMPRRGIESQYTKGYTFTLLDGKWHFRKGKYYAHTLKEFEIVGEIENPDKIIEKALFDAVIPFIQEADHE